MPCGNKQACSAATSHRARTVRPCVTRRSSGCTTEFLVRSRPTSMMRSTLLNGGRGAEEQQARARVSRRRTAAVAAAATTAAAANGAMTPSPLASGFS